MDVNFIMAFENGELNKEEVIAGFQKGIDSGLVWKLQGFYGRTAKRLIDQGLCKLREEQIITWRIEYMARLQGTTGEFALERCIVKAPTHTSALKKGRKRLQDLGYEISSGTATKDEY